VIALPASALAMGMGHSSTSGSAAGHQNAAMHQAAAAQHVAAVHHTVAMRHASIAARHAARHSMMPTGSVDPSASVPATGCPFPSRGSMMPTASLDPSVTPMPFGPFPGMMGGFGPHGADHMGGWVPPIGSVDPTVSVDPTTSVDPTDAVPVV
jgi:hypothetical protein